MGTWPEAVPFVPRLLLERQPDAPRQWSTEATMVMVDISGFTSLSEQLARRGRVGAEDLVSTLTRIFTLLMAASDDGGDVVKFAGDALLVQYDGPDHVRHACHAATAMQRLLRVVGRVRLAGAQARLRMSVGVHTGRFDLLLVGGEHPNLIVGGPAIDRLLELQDAAAPGEILVSDEVAVVLPGSACRRQDRGIELINTPAVASVGSLSVSGHAVPDVTRFLPAAFEARPDLLVADSDHRRAAMGFVQVSGLNALLASGDPLPELERITTAVERACAETGTTLLDTDVARDGYRYFLTAGAPHGVEDPEGRMVRALLRIVEEGGQSVRAGAAAGQVFAGPVGAPARRTFSVMGDTTNLAARLTTRAPAGGVLAHAPALARSRTTFSTAVHDPVTVKGKKEPVPVVVVTDVVGRRARSDVELAFVGRERELTELGKLLADAHRGEGAVVEVVGEAGLGKTRLVAEAIRRSGLPSVTLISDPYGATVPFLALRRLLRPLLGLADADDLAASAARLRDVVHERAPQLERWLPLLGPVVGADLPPSAAVDELDDRFRTARVRDAVRSLLDALLPAPSVVLLDDAQWVDQSSAEVLSGVFAAVGSRSLAVVLTRRDADGGLRGNDDLATTLLRPEPVPAEVARRLLLDASGGSLRPAELDAIIGQADGNPYFLIELASGGRTGELPGTIEELVGMRIDDLDGADRDVLRQAAVLGARFPASLFAQATGIRDLARLVRGSGLTSFLDVGEDGTVAFRRDVFRETAYAQLTFRRRRRVHHAAALAIEDSPELAGGARLPLLSLHYSFAGVWPEAYDCSRRAAEVARTQFANEEAAVFCRRALDAGRRCRAPGAEMWALRVTLGEVLNLAGRHEEAVRAYQTARRAGTAPAEAVDVVYRIGMVRREEGRFPAALAAARQVRALADSLSRGERDHWLAEADLLVAGVRYWQGRSAECREASIDAVARAEGLLAGTDRTRLLARAYALHDSAVVELDGSSGEYGDLPIEMFGEIGDLYNQGRFCVNVAIGHYYEGRWDRAIAMYRQSLDLAERTGDVFSVAVAQMNIGELLAHQGRSADAREMLATSLASLGALHTPLAAAHAACYLGIAARMDGDLGEATARLDESARLFAEAGRTDGFSMDELATRRLELLLDRGDLEAALAEGGSMLVRSPGPVPVHRARVHRSVGLALWAAGDRAAADGHLADSLRSADEVSSTYESALTLLAQAELGLGDPDEARARAVPFLESIGVRDVALVTPRAPVAAAAGDR